nr:ABC transporter A family member 9-like [Tanacetum cinerariifolium]
VLKPELLLQQVERKGTKKAVEKRFRGNAATKKTQGNLLKQQYENFTTSRLEVCAHLAPKSLRGICMGTMMYHALVLLVSSIGIMLRDTLVDICFRLGISTGKEVNIELGGGCDKVLRPADMLLYSWVSGFDVCVDLTGSSPLTWTGMADFVSGRAVIDISQRKRGKYMAKCVAIGYEFC